jgi:DNA-binding CsgD family transcriptional regulator
MIKTHRPAFSLRSTMPLLKSPDWDELFFTAALEPKRWPDALGMMASHTGSAHGQLIGVGGGDARNIPFNILTDFPQSDAQDFVEMGGGSPTLNFRIAACNVGIARGDYDGVIHEKHYDAAIPTLQSDRYIRFCEKTDIPFGCQANLVVDQAGLIGLAVLRKRTEGRTNAWQRRVFAQAAEAARRAVRLQERIEGDQARLLAGTFEAIRATAFILDARGRVQAMTQSAEEIVSNTSIRLRGGYLAAEGMPLSLTQGIKALVTDGGLDHLRLRIDQPGRKLPLFLEGFRLPQRRWSLGSLPHAILLAKPPQRDRAGIAAFLTALYRLTPSEADVAMRLYDGANRSDIAAMREVTDETLRGQVKNICAKTGSRNEAELMRVLGAIMA